MTINTSPSNEVPPTLVPIRRGAVIDWKATAIAEHANAERASALSKANFRLQTTNERLNNELANAYDLTAKHFAKLAAIRAHWSAFLLPTELR